MIMTMNVRNKLEIKALKMLSKSMLFVMLIVAGWGCNTDDTQQVVNFNNL